MNHFNSGLLTSLIKMWPWLLIFFIGFIIGISLGGIWLGVSPNLGITVFYMVSTNKAAFGEIVFDLIKILLIALICLLIPINKYATIAGKIVILLLSACLGVICALSIKSASSAYFSIISLLVLELAFLWCLAIGTLKINFVEKSRLALMPVSLAAIVSLGRAFF
ncbi:MAG: hypothetical protein VB084_09335 [Syntrophomonadaceae bacterium]|nr:hypothetical protein [Syntrophomonadaceae bacterium]